MVNPGFLKNERIIEWLGGIEPVWMLLDFDSYCRLQRRPGENNRALHLAADLSAAEIAASPFVVNALTLLRMAETQGSIKLTTSGNLARDVVTQLAETCTWPTFDLGLVRSLTKVLNEADVWPLELLHRVAVEARLLRRKGRALILAPNGRKALKAGGAQDLMSRLFEIAFWRINLGYWDGHPVSTWPQSDIGVITWGLSLAAATWATPVRLARLTTIPVNGVLDAEPDFSGPALELRVLRFLTFFGLLEAEHDLDSTDRFLPRRRYRKAPLFDRFFSFDVTLEPNDGIRH